ncbi:MAG: hypothetical protein WAM14_12810, partial [Candidatus Nitrosopolaris sp.]
MFDEQTNPKIMFFLGAGASVPADMKGVVELVNDYKEWPSSNDKLEDRKIVEEIEETLLKWLARQNIDRQVDIELVLETIERLENAKSDILLDFFADKKFKRSQFKENGSLSKGLKQFLREKCFIQEHKTRYLKPLLDFLNLYNTLSIFSTNYDNKSSVIANVILAPSSKLLVK